MADLYRIIIIDDEEKILDGMVNLFPWEQIGFQVVARFMNAQKAAAYVEHNPVDVILSDIEMPEMTGIDLCKKLSNKYPVKIVFFSSYQNYEYFRSAIQYSVEDYLLKPVKYQELLACFEKIKEKLDYDRKVSVEMSNSYYEKIIMEITEYLQDNYQNASLEEAAEKVNLSASYLSRIFKEKSGCTFSDTLTKIRMDKAKEMLDDLHYKSYDIAFYLGYDNPKNFSRAFKAFFQMTPSEYRKGKNVEES